MDFLEYPVMMETIIHQMTEKYKFVFGLSMERYLARIEAIQTDLLNENAERLVQERIKAEREIYEKMSNNSLDTRYIKELCTEEERIKNELCDTMCKRYEDEFVNIGVMTREVSQDMMHCLKREIIWRALSFKINIEDALTRETDKVVDKLLENLRVERNKIYNEQLSALRKMIHQEIKKMMKEVRVRTEQNLLKDCKAEIQSEVDIQEEIITKSLREKIVEFVSRKEKEVMGKIQTHAAEQIQLMEKIVTEYFGKEIEETLHAKVNKELVELEGQLRTEKYAETVQKIETASARYERELRHILEDEKVSKLYIFNFEMARLLELKRERDMAKKLSLTSENKTCDSDNLNRKDSAEARY